MKNNGNKTSLKKLSLSKETLRQLDNPDLMRALGGQRPETMETYCGQRGCTATSPTEMGLC